MGLSTSVPMYPHPVRDHNLKGPEGPLASSVLNDLPLGYATPPERGLLSLHGLIKPL